MYNFPNLAPLVAVGAITLLLIAAVLPPALLYGLLWLAAPRLGIELDFWLVWGVMQAAWTAAGGFWLWRTV